MTSNYRGEVPLAPFKELKRKNTKRHKNKDY